MPPNESNGDYECGRDSTCPDYHFLPLVKVAERGMRLSADRVWKAWERPILDPRPARCKNVFRPVVCDQARNTAPRLGGLATCAKEVPTSLTREPRRRRILH